MGFGVWRRAFGVEDVFGVWKRAFGLGVDVFGVCNPVFGFGKTRRGVGVEGSGAAHGLWLGRENDTRLGAWPVRLADISGRIC